MSYRIDERDIVEARARKAAKVAAVLAAAYASTGVAVDPAQLTDDQWKLAEQAAQVRPLSPTSRSLVIALMSVAA